MSASLLDTRDDGNSSQLLMLKASEVAEILSVSQRTLWRLLSTKKLPEPIRVGGCPRWRKSDIEAWIANGCTRSVNDQQ